MYTKSWLSSKLSTYESNLEYVNVAKLTFFYEIHLKGIYCRTTNTFKNRNLFNYVKDKVKQICLPQLLMLYIEVTK